MKLGHVALDGTKIKANASKHKAMSYDRMKKREADVDRWLRTAEAADAEEEKRYGNLRGDEMPDWVVDKQKRLENIREAKAALEAEAKAAAEAESKARAEAEECRIAEGRKKSGKPPAPAKMQPDGKTQRNFTNPAFSASFNTCTNSSASALRCRRRNSEIVRKSGGSPATIIMKSARSTVDLAIRRDELMLLA